MTNSGFLFRSLCFLSLLILFGQIPALAGTFTAFGPQSYQRQTGAPVTVTHNFSVRNPAATYKLQIYNGGMEDEEFERVSSSVISINGQQILGPSDFNQHVAYLERDVSLAAANSISVELRGKPGGGITVVISGTDNDAPVISASATPLPNASGWNNSNVAVSFICDDITSGVAVCPGPVTVSGEGANQVVQGIATDAAGNSASASLTVNLDRSAPVVMITSPANGATLNAPEISVSGNDSDSLSGVVTILCNGVSATLSGSSFSCPVTLSSGSNLIQTQATDVAGNTAAVSVTVTLAGGPGLPPPSALEIAPGRAALLVGEERELSVVDELGRPRSGINWTVSNPAVLEIVTSDGRTLFRALAAGVTNLTAELAGLQAFAEVTVFAGASLPAGTVKWAVEPKAGFATARVLQAQPSENGPTAMAIEGGSSGEILVRGFGVDGRQMWETLAALPAPPEPEIPSSVAQFGVQAMRASSGTTLISAGGFSDDPAMWQPMPRPASAALAAALTPPAEGPPALVTFTPYNDGGSLMGFRPNSEQFLFRFTSILRIDGATGERLWRYDSPGGFQGWAIHPDGTIFFLEHTGTVTVNTIFSITRERDAQAHLVALDGATGAVRFRVPVPASRFRHSAQGCSNPTPFPADLDGAPSFGLPSVLEDGSVYFEFLVTDHNWIESSVPGFDFCEPFRYEIGADLRLGTVTPTGEFSSRILQTFPFTISCFVSHGACAVPVRDVDMAQFSDVIPDGAGGALAAWRAVNSSALPRITRVNAGAAVEYGIPFASFQPGNGGTLINPGLVLGEEGVAFASNGLTAIAFEVATGAARWSWTPPTQPSGAPSGVQIITSAAGNGLVVITHDNSGFPFFGTVARLDSNGQATFDSWSATGIQYAFGNLWFAQGSLQAISAPRVENPNSRWPRVAQQLARAPAPTVEVRVTRVREESRWTNDAITAHVHSAVRYWQLVGGILLRWDNVIEEVSACPPARPQCDALNDVESILEISSAQIDGPNLARRFPNRLGVNLVFTRFVRGDALTLSETNTQTGQTRFLNVVTVKLEAQDVVPHELGHVFQLEHVGIFQTRNLQCGPRNLVESWLNFCNVQQATELTADQIRKAKAGERALR